MGANPRGKKLHVSRQPNCSCQRILGEKIGCHKIKVISRIILISFSAGYIPLDSSAADKQSLLRRKFGRMANIFVTQIGLESIRIKVICFKCVYHCDFGIRFDELLSQSQHPVAFQ